MAKRAATTKILIHEGSAVAHLRLEMQDALFSRVGVDIGRKTANSRPKTGQAESHSRSVVADKGYLCSVFGAFSVWAHRVRHSRTELPLGCLISSRRIHCTLCCQQRCKFLTACCLNVASLRDGRRYQFAEDSKSTVLK